MDRVAEPLALMGAAVEGNGPSCRPPLRVKGGSLRGHRLDGQGGERAGEVSHLVGRPLGERDDRRARGRDDPYAHRRDAGRRGGRHLRRAVGGGTGDQPARLGPPTGRPRRARRPVAVRLLRRGGLRRPRQRGRGGRRLQRPCSPRLRLGPPADGRRVHLGPRRARHDGHPGVGGAVAWHRRARPRRSPRSTRSPRWRWRPRWPRGPPCSPTSASSG